MELTVLGTYGGFPAANKSCMGHILQTKETNLLIDCGTGVCSKLQNYLTVDKIDAIILSHLHYDHISDMLSLKYAIEVGMKFSNFKPIDVYCPFSPIETLQLLKSPAFNLIPIDQNKQIKIKDVEVSFKRTTHDIETYAMSFVSSQKKISYSADTGYNEELISLFYGSDLLISETSLLIDQKGNTSSHLTTEETVLLSNKSKIKKLLITHFWYQINPEEYLKECLDKKPLCDIEIAIEDKVYII